MKNPSALSEILVFESLRRCAFLLKYGTRIVLCASFQMPGKVAATSISAATTGRGRAASAAVAPGGEQAAPGQRRGLSIDRHQLPPSGIGAASANTLHAPAAASATCTLSPGDTAPNCAATSRVAVNRSGVRSDASMSKTMTGPSGNAGWIWPAIRSGPGSRSSATVPAAPIHGLPPNTPSRSRMP